MENFERIKTKRVTIHKYQEPDHKPDDEILVAVQLRKISSVQLQSGEAHHNSKCLIL